MISPITEVQAEFCVNPEETQRVLRRGAGYLPLEISWSHRFEARCVKSCRAFFFFSSNKGFMAKREIAVALVESWWAKILGSCHLPLSPSPHAPPKHVGPREIILKTTELENAGRSPPVPCQSVGPPHSLDFLVSHTVWIIRGAQ